MTEIAPDELGGTHPAGHAVIIATGKGFVEALAMCLRNPRARVVVLNSQDRRVTLHGFSCALPHFGV